jgi:VCBS repeat-containing protein
MAASGFFRPEETRGGAADQIFEQAVAWAAGKQDEGIASTDEDSVLAIDVLANDTDVDFGDVLAVGLMQPTSTRGAALWIDTSGEIVYDPRASAALQALAAGQVVTDSFEYEVSDGNGGTDTASVSITVAGLADPALGGTGDDGLSLGFGTPDADVLL